MATLNPSGLYCAYLRKSRRDVELEALGQGETLARHEKQLNELAQRLGITISRTYREIVSGDTIAERPQVQQLLQDVNAGMWAGVLAMDVDRFGRGDTIDQGIIMQTFFFAGVLVVTPDKIYDPADDSDREFFEVKLFFARREYNMIKKRMQRGRIQSALDGCYPGSRSPYGYERVKLKGRKGWTLEINPQEAEIVRSMFRWYAYGMDGETVGADIIARHLNDMGIPSDRGKPWIASTVRHMLQHPIYIGKIRWNHKTTQYRINDGKREKKRLPCENEILVDGLHEPIIDMALWDKVQMMFETHEKRPRSAMKKDANPFAGLMYCSECGHKMQIKGDAKRRGDSICCPTRGCPTCNAYVFVCEGAVLDTLARWVSDYEAQQAEAAPAPDPDAAARAVAIEQHRQKLAVLEGQSNRLYDLLEQGVYTVDVYRQRRADLDAKIAASQAAIDQLQAAARPKRSIGPLIPQIRTVLDAYRSAETPADKNALLRTVVGRIVYHKTQRNYRNNDLGDNLTLSIYPKYPGDQDAPEAPEKHGV